MAAGAPSAGQRRLNVVLSADISNFTRGLQTAQKQLQASARTMIAIGQQLAFQIALPLAAAGTAITKLTNDYEAMGNRLVTQTNVTRKQLGGLTKSIEALSDSLGVDKIQLMTTAYAVAGAGISDVNDIMEALAETAKLTAIGLGDQETIARAITSVMNAYGSETVNAARASNAFLLAVKEGNFAAPQFAESIGEIVGIAAAMGISLEQIVAGVSAYSRVIGDAGRATIGFRNILTDILSPSAKAIGIWDQLFNKTMGQGIVQVRELLSQDLVGTLRSIAKAMEGQPEVADQLFDNVRGLEAFLSVFTSQGDEVIDIFNRIVTETNAVDKAWNELAGSGTRVWGVLQTEVINLAVAMGQELFGTIKDIALEFGAWLQVLRPVIVANTKLIASVALLTIGFIGTISALGVFILLATQVVGAVIGTARAVLKLIKTLEGLVVMQAYATGGMNVLLGAIAVGIATIFGMNYAIGKLQDTLSEPIGLGDFNIEDLKKQQQEIKAQWEKQIELKDKFDAEMAKSSGGGELDIKPIEGFQIDTTQIQEGLKKVGELMSAETFEVTKLQARWDDFTAETVKNLGDLRTAMEKAQIPEENRKSLEEAFLAVRNLHGASQIFSDTSKDLTDAIREEQTALADLTGKVTDFDSATNETLRTIDLQIEKLRALQRAQEQTGQGAGFFASLWQGITALFSGPSGIELQIQQLEEMRASFLKLRGLHEIAQEVADSTKTLQEMIDDLQFDVMTQGMESTQVEMLRGLKTFDDVIKKLHELGATQEQVAGIEALRSKWVELREEMTQKEISTQAFEDLAAMIKEEAIALGVATSGWSDYEAETQKALRQFDEAIGKQRALAKVTTETATEVGTSGQYLAALGSIIGDQISAWVDSAKTALDDLANSFVQPLRDAAQRFAKFFEGIVGGFADMTGRIVDAVKDWGSQLVAASGAAIGGLATSVKDALKSIDVSVLARMFSVALKDAAASVQAFLQSLVSDFARIGGPIVAALRGWVGKLIDAIASSGLGKAIVGIASAIRSALQSIDVAVIGRRFTEAFKDAAASAQSFLASLVSAFANISGPIVNAVKGWVGKVVDAIGAAALAVGGAIGAIVTSIGDALRAIDVRFIASMFTAALTEAAARVQSFLQNLVSAFADIGAPIVATVEAWVGQIVAAISASALGQAFTAAFKDALASVQGFLRNLVSAFAEIGGQIVAGVKGWLGQVIDAIAGSDLGKAVSAIVTRIDEALQAIDVGVIARRFTQAFNEAAASAQAFLGSLVSDFAGIGGQIVDAVTGWSGQIVGALGSTADAIASTLGDAFRAIDVAGIGAEIVDTVKGWAGKLGDALGSVGGAIGEFATSISDALKAIDTAVVERMNKQIGKTAEAAETSVGALERMRQAYLNLRNARRAPEELAKVSQQLTDMVKEQAIHLGQLEGNWGSFTIETQKGIQVFDEVIARQKELGADTSVIEWLTKIRQSFVDLRKGVQPQEIFQTAMGELPNLVKDAAISLQDLQSGLSDFELETNRSVKTFDQWLGQLSELDAPEELLAIINNIREAYIRLRGELGKELKFQEAFEAASKAIMDASFHIDAMNRDLTDAQAATEATVRELESYVAALEAIGAGSSEEAQSIRLMISAFKDIAKTEEVTNVLKNASKDLNDVIADQQRELAATRGQWQAFRAETASGLVAFEKQAEALKKAGGSPDDLAKIEALRQQFLGVRHALEGATVFVEGWDQMIKTIVAEATDLRKMTDGLSDFDAETQAVTDSLQPLIDRLEELGFKDKADELRNFLDVYGQIRTIRQPVEVLKDATADLSAMVRDQAVALGEMTSGWDDFRIETERGLRVFDEWLAKLKDTGGTQAQVDEIERLRQAYINLRGEIEKQNHAIVIDLKSSLIDAISSVTQAIFSGTQDWRDYLEIFSDIGIGILVDMFKQIIEKKVGELDIPFFDNIDDLQAAIEQIRKEVGEGVGAIAGVPGTGALSPEEINIERQQQGLPPLPAGGAAGAGGVGGAGGAGSVTGVGELLGGLTDTLQNFFMQIRDLLQMIWDQLVELGDQIVELGSFIVDTLTDLWNDMTNKIETVGRKVEQLQQWMIARAKFQDSMARTQAIIGAIGSISGSLASTSGGPRAEGGITRRASWAYVGEAGPEAIVPLSKMSNYMTAPETTVVVNSPHPATVRKEEGPDERKIEIIIDDVIARSFRSGGKASQSAERSFGLKRQGGTR